MDSDVTGSGNPGPEEGEAPQHRQGTEDPGEGGKAPGQGSSNPGPDEGGDRRPGRGSGDPGPEE
jgi:hypothetical protein